MPTILCPTRGGPASFANQDRAIALARERQARLVFLYVSDIRFLDHMASPLLVDVQTELDEMGDFMLAMAQERAAKAGVRAETSVRRGVFRHALRDTIREHGVSTVVMGSSGEEFGVSAPAYLQEMISWLMTETGVEVLITREGEIAAEHRP